MVYSSPPGFPRGTENISYDDSRSQILSSSTTEDLQSIIEELSQKKDVIVEPVDLRIPANTWTPIPLPGSLSEAYDYRLFVDETDITESVSSRKAQNSFELLSFTDLQTTVLIQGIK